MSDSEIEQDMSTSTKRVNPAPARKRGTREDVWAGYAAKTAGGLSKDDLMQTSKGRIVSKRASEKSRQLMLDRNSKQKPPLLKKEEPAELSASDVEAEPPKLSKPSKPKPKPVQKVETPSKSTVVIHTQQKKKMQKPKK